MYALDSTASPAIKKVRIEVVIEKPPMGPQKMVLPGAELDFLQQKSEVFGMHYFPKDVTGGCFRTQISTVKAPIFIPESIRKQKSSSKNLLLKE